MGLGSTQARSLGALIAAAVAVAVIAAPASAQPTTPIPSVAVPPPPAFTGQPATAQPIRGVPPTPRNPFMAPNGESEIHDDGWQTDASTWGGPLGHSPQVSSTYIQRDCGSITFDHQGRVISVCVGAGGPQLYMFDPKTLDTLATFMLPPRQSVPSNANLFQDFTGGGYFYLDNQDRVVTSTTTHHIYVIAETPSSPGFTLVHDYDLTSVLSSGENLTSALPDSHGLLWFVTKSDGVVGTLDFATGTIHKVQLGNGTAVEIENSFATDMNGGVYIATNRKLYRFGAGRDGVPKIVWQVTYPNSGIHKPGQVDDGTGTTPTIMPGGYVNITDNADPMNVMVYRTAPHPIRIVRRHRHRRRVPLSRQVCKFPIFSRGASADENSIISAGDTMIAEDNYGYTDPTSVQGKTTSPGFVRIDLNRNGRGCHRVWLNATQAAPTVVSKVALASGLVYSYTLDDTTGDWYWTALDFRTGKTVYRAYAGTGLGWNNNYAGISISPQGVEYLGALGGLMSLRDGG
jgi:hypothetical protein